MAGQSSLTRISARRSDAFRLALSLCLTVVAFRFFLWFFPEIDFVIAGYPVHHLFSGLVLIVLAGIPLILRHGPFPGRSLLVSGFGIGLGMALDEAVYLIATGATNSEYSLPVSLWGAVGAIFLTCLYLALLETVWRGRDHSVRDAPFRSRQNNESP